MPQLSEAAAELTFAACAKLDLATHQATHPRLGVVDHIACHPLTNADDLQCAAEVAVNIGQLLGEGSHSRDSLQVVSAEPASEEAALPTKDPEEISSSQQGIPCLLYGAAHPTSRPLDEIRRAFQYFRGASAGMHVRKAATLATSASNFACIRLLQKRPGYCCSCAGISSLPLQAS